MSGGILVQKPDLFSSLVMGDYILYLAWDLYQEEANSILVLSEN